MLLELRSLGFKRKQISDMLLVSRWTIRRRVVEFGIEETTGFTDITDSELDGLVQQFMLARTWLLDWMRSDKWTLKITWIESAATESERKYCSC